jgi:hypothetical protein
MNGGSPQQAPISQWWQAYPQVYPTALLNVPSKAGYTFKGYGYWQWSYVNGNTWYGLWDEFGKPANYFVSGSNFTVEALWVAEDYILKIDNQGGNITPANPEEQEFTIKYDDKLPVLYIAPTKFGYTFGGYYDQPNGQGTQYYDSQLKPQRDKYGNANDTNLYAYWVSKQYTIKLIYDNSNIVQGTGGDTSVAVALHQDMPYAKAPTPIQSGYVFDGYYQAPFGEGTKYYNADMSSAHVYDNVNSANNIVYTNIYANFVKLPAQYAMVNLDPTNGQAPFSLDLELGKPMPTILKPIKENSTFLGYYDTKDTSGKKYYNANGTSARNWDGYNDMWIYAVWQPKDVTPEPNNKHTIYLDNQDGGYKPSELQVEVGKAMPAITIPEYSGTHSIGSNTTACFVFNGYYNTKDTSGKMYYDNTGASVRNWDGTNGSTLYAVWEEKIVTSTSKVTLEDGFNISITITVEYNKPMPAGLWPPMHPDFEGNYIFMGYFDDRGVQYYDGDMNSMRNWDRIDANVYLGGRYRKGY